VNRTSRRSRRRSFLRVAGFLLLLGAVFVVGVAVGEALHDRPDLGGSQTIVRTLTPITIAPAAQTVTVTSSSP